MSIYDAESVYEVIGINKIIKSAEVELTLKYITDVTYLVDESDNYVCDEFGNKIIYTFIIFI